MKSATMKLVCHILIVTLMMLPFQMVQAGMIATDQAASAMSPQTDRGAVLSVIDRIEVASQLQAMGLDPKAAKDRVAAMTDEEVRTLANRIDSLPAGASSGWAVAAVIVIALIIWYVWK